MVKSRIRSKITWDLKRPGQKNLEQEANEYIELDSNSIGNIFYRPSIILEILTPGKRQIFQHIYLPSSADDKLPGWVKSCFGLRLPTRTSI